MSKEIYRHYYKNKGAKFNYKSFKPIANFTRPWNKPYGGLWASRVDAIYPWDAYCTDEGLDWCSNDYFEFTLKDDSNILYLRDISDIDDIVNNKSLYLLKCMDSLRLTQYFEEHKYDNTATIPMLVLDFEYLVSHGIDAIDVEIEKLKYILYGWDCDSTLIMNPDIIVLS